MSKDKHLALNLLIDKQSNSTITYEYISSQSGYSKRQLIRWYSQLNAKKDMSSLFQHGNVGKEPSNKASLDELKILRTLKETYPKITISQFRDIYLEDIIFNPDKIQIVEQNHLKERSLTWFRNLFISEGSQSPESRKPLRRDGRAAHPLRKPSAQRGMLVQIDGTPYDWLGTGEMWTLHLAVDDATSEPLAGVFLPTERQFGYCMLMKLIIQKHGIPMALYSDKHSIFKSSKDGNLTQFGMMMEDLGIEFIFANTPQAKGRIERYNGTVQRRLPNDVIRFGIKDYDTLNEWFNTFYIPYLNRKFAFVQLDPNDAFVQIEEFNIDDIFELRYERTIKNDMFSFDSSYYCLINEDGEKIHIINDTKVHIRINVFSGEITVLRYGKRYRTVLVGDKKRKRQTTVDNQKDLDEILDLIKNK